jgi:hypothetical protein
MARALTLAGRPWQKCAPGCWPLYGLAFLGVTGPWEAPGVPIGAAYARTHWCAVAVRDPEGDDADHYVYDINAQAWLPGEEWGREVMARVVASHKRATGWRSRAALEVGR